MKYQPYLFILCSAAILSSCFDESNDNFDTDGDGMLDKYDACPYDPNKYDSPGECGCGNVERVIGDEVRCLYNIAGDRDQDGVVDEEDECPDKPFKFLPGYCGCERYDLDKDNDGALDFCEMLPGDDEHAFDDIVFPDECPNSPKIVPGFCDCGYDDLDNDGDGYIDGCGKGAVRPDAFPDRCPNDKDKHERGICGCGVPDIDSDNDLVFDCLDQCPNDSEKRIPGICGCGEPETDSDNDKTPDCIDLCPDDPNKNHPGICGCHKSDTLDSDNDGLIDCDDQCPNDPDKVEPGKCGCGSPDTDLNNNGIIDCLEPCPEDSLLAGQLPGICGCNMRDVDSDDDGVLDCLDACPLNKAKQEDAGLCGCDYETEEDTDGDKIADCVDACPDDPLKSDSEGACGCGNLETDQDGDGTPDCVDACPDDPTQTELGDCGCGLHPILETSTDGEGVETTLTICPAEGGLLSLDNMFPGFSAHEKDTQNAIMERYQKRTTPNHVVNAYFIPGGNALKDPHILYLDKYWDIQYGIFRNSSFTDEHRGPRPFPQYPVYIGGTDSNTNRIQQSVNNPYFGIQDVQVRFGVLGGTTYKDNYSSDSLELNDQYYNCDNDDFSFFTSTQTLSKDDNHFNFILYSESGTIDTLDSAYSNGAATQGFQVFFGDPEVRFSTDGKNWTDWITYSDSSSDDMWKTEMELPEGYGFRYAFMQTRNATLPPVVDGEEPPKNVSPNYIYYETSNRIMVKDPHHDAILQIGEVDLDGSFDNKDDIEKEMASRSTYELNQTLYYTPGNNLISDGTFEAESHSKWVFENVEVAWKIIEKRVFALLPELFMKDTSFISQRLIIPEKYQGEPCEISFWAVQSYNQSISADIRMFDTNGIILDYGEKSIHGNSYNNYYQLRTTFLDDTASLILQIKANSYDEGEPHIQSVRVGAGNTYVRFSNDRKHWSIWEEATGRKNNWQLSDCTPSESDPKLQNCTVTMQTFDLTTREFSEASASILYNPGDEPGDESD